MKWMPHHSLNFCQTKFRLIKGCLALLHTRFPLPSTEINFVFSSCQHIQYILKQCFPRAHFQNSTSSRTWTFLLAGQPHLQSLFRFALNVLKNALKIYLHIVTIEGRAITVSFLSRLMLVVMTRIGDGNGEVYLYEKSTLSWGPSVELTIFENKLASSTMC